jgi:hypothetical protein
MFPERPRPVRLSNRNCCYSDDELVAIDGKDIGQLTWNDFEAIFPLSGCTAEYDQQLYYLPLALNYLRGHPGEGNEFVAGLVFFIASHQDRLATDGLLEASLAQLRACFEEWMSKFEVTHLDAAACAAKGWRVELRDYVENSSAVHELIEELLRYGLDRLVEELMDSWVAVRRSPRDAAWLLEFAREEREYEDYSRENLTLMKRSHESSGSSGTIFSFRLPMTRSKIRSLLLKHLRRTGTMSSSHSGSPPEYALPFSSIAFRKAAISSRSALISSSVARSSGARNHVASAAENAPKSRPPRSSAARR